jgi:3-methyladenine DNA glycosylase AlkD
MSVTEALQHQLDLRADPKTQTWWEGYLKHAIPFRGVKMADIRAALHQWVQEEGIAQQPAAQQKDLALDLIRLDYCEDKLAGILFLQEILLPAGAVRWQDDLPRFARLFEQGHIYEWNTCDWFCVRVLGPLAEQQGPASARAIADWRTAGNLWRRRASGVAFVNLARRGEDNFPGFVNMLLEVCTATVQTTERFAQTGTGWVLRELSLAEPQRVIGFVEEHLGCFSTEGLAYAMEKLPAETTARLKAAHRARRKEASKS